MTTQKQLVTKENQDTVFLRFPAHYLETFDQEIEKRGIEKRTDAIRQLMAAWMRNPDALPIGFTKTEE